MVKGRGFTLIEMLVVFAAIGLLLSIVAPRYVHHVDHARSVALKQNLLAMRMALDQYRADKGHYPLNLQAVVDAGYLREAPLDPVTGKIDSWVTKLAPDGGVLNVQSGALGTDELGKKYAEY